MTAVLSGAPGAAVTWIVVTGFVAERPCGQVQAAGGLLARRTGPGHRDRRAGPELGKDTGPVMALPVPVTCRFLGV